MRCAVGCGCFDKQGLRWHVPMETNGGAGSHTLLLTRAWRWMMHARTRTCSVECVVGVRACVRACPPMDLWGEWVWC